MGSAGLEWDSNDQPSQARLNQKTTFVGTGAQINALSTTYAGQMAFCTSTGSGFTVDVLYVRDSTNSSWTQFLDITAGITEGGESNTTPVTDDAEINPVAGTRYYAIFTLPQTETLYYVTGIEWKNGTAVAGNVISGVDMVDATTPTINSTTLLALGQEVAQSGTSAVQRVSIVSSKLIRGGTICGAWISCSSASATIREDNGSANSFSKATSFDSQPSACENTAFTSSVDGVYIKVYYRGYD